MRSASANIPRPGDEANADEALLFVYDGWNRLVKVYKDDGDSESQGEIDENDTLVATYQYDGFGRRIQKTVGETTDDYYCSEGWQVLETRRGGDPDPLDQFIWDVRYVDAPVVRFHDGNTDGDLDGGSQEGDNTLYYTTDANWNVTALVDAATGNVVERYMYDPYGKATVLEPDWTADSDGVSDVANDILYAGYRFDAETGLYATDRGVYHPTLGRWLQRDPAGYLDGANLYGYVSGNPAGLTDPSGLCGETAPNPGDVNPWWIKRTGPDTFEMLLPWIEGMRPEIRLLPWLPGMGAEAVPVPLASASRDPETGFSPDNQRYYEKLFPQGKGTSGGKDQDSGSNSPSTNQFDDNQAEPGCIDAIVAAADRLIARILALINGFFGTPTPQDLGEPDMLAAGAAANLGDGSLAGKARQDLEKEAAGKAKPPAGQLAPKAPETAPSGKSIPAPKRLNRAESSQWRNARPWRQDMRTNGLSGKDRRYYTWDHTHGDIEVFDSRGRHLGTMDPQSGQMIKPAVPGRKIDP